MPRNIPPLAAAFAHDVQLWVDLARSGEVVRVAAASNATVRAELRPARLEALYEVAYLRMFLSWETYLEESLTRLICGYSLGAPGLTLSGTAFSLVGPAIPTLAAGTAVILGSAPYVSWADADKVIKRSRKFVNNGPHETILLSASPRLAWFTDVRNRIAHPSTSARLAFDQATMGLAGRRYRASSPGRFLRDWDTSVVPQQRRLLSIGDELANLAGQISR